jgi:hypothetical protein
LGKFLLRVQGGALLYGAFSFGRRGAKEKAWQKENAVFMGSAQTRKLLKKLDQNFQSRVRCEQGASKQKRPSLAIAKPERTM